tara:strand:- start:1505 stop:2341 length:837 start_codon:yes stop_codon:yes gene_type:complete
MENWRNFLKEDIDDPNTIRDWRAVLRDAIVAQRDSMNKRANQPKTPEVEKPKKKGFFDFLKPKWQRQDFDAPADGLSPLDNSFYDVHAGGMDSSIPKLTPPDEIPDPPVSTDPSLGAPIRNRKALEIDPLPGQEDSDLRQMADAGVQQKLKSDRDLNMPSWSEQSAKVKAAMNAEIDQQEKKLTELEAANTITPQEAEQHMQRMREWHKVLGHVDTLPLDLFKIADQMQTVDERIEELDPDWDSSVKDRQTQPQGSYDPPEEEETLAGDFNPFAIFDK